MSNRVDPWNALVKQGLMSKSKYTGYIESITDWDKLAKIHAQARNDVVVFILMHLKMMQVKGLLPSIAVNVKAATRQMNLGVRTEIREPSYFEAYLVNADLNESEKRRIKKKCFSTQDAHCVPCQITIGGKDIQDFLQSPSQEYMMEYAHLNAQFAVVHRMPTLFNEADSHAESRGLTEALAKGCRAILSRNPTGLNVAQLERAFRIYLVNANTAINCAITANLLEADKSSETGERIYRTAKSEILSKYVKHTQNHRPEYTTKPNLVKIFSARWGS